MFDDALMKYFSTIVGKISKRVTFKYGWCDKETSHHIFAMEYREGLTVTPESSTRTSMEEGRRCHEVKEFFRTVLEDAKRCGDM